MHRQETLRFGVEAAEKQHKHMKSQGSGEVSLVVRGSNATHESFTSLAMLEVAFSDVIQVASVGKSFSCPPTHVRVVGKKVVVALADTSLCSLSHETKAAGHGRHVRCAVVAMG